MIANPIVAGLSRIPRKQRRGIKKRNRGSLFSNVVLADSFLSEDRGFEEIRVTFRDETFWSGS